MASSETTVVKIKSILLDEILKKYKQNIAKKKMVCTKIDWGEPIHLVNFSEKSSNLFLIFVFCMIHYNICKHNQKCSSGPLLLVLSLCSICFLIMLFLWFINSPIMKLSVLIHRK